MIADFEDFCLWTYVVVDELWCQLPPAYKRGSGPAPACSDCELLTLALVGECRGWTTEATLPHQWAVYRHLFPQLPERRRLNRRRRGLWHALNAIRRAVIAVLDVAQGRQCAIDSLPVPVLAFHLVPSAAGAGGWRAAGADYGKVPTRKQTIFGDKLHLLVTLGGVIRDFALAPASASGVAVGAGLPREQANLVALAAEPRAERAVALLTVPRRNQRRQLTAQFGLARHRAHTFHSLCARLHTKLAAHPLHLSQPPARGQRMAPDQGARFPQLAHHPK